jgi:hypothetical protein
MSLCVTTSTTDFRTPNGVTLCLFSDMTFLLGRKAGVGPGGEDISMLSIVIGQPPVLRDLPEIEIIKWHMPASGRKPSGQCLLGYDDWYYTLTPTMPLPEVGTVIFESHKNPPLDATGKPQDAQNP